MVNSRGKWSLKINYEKIKVADTEISGPIKEGKEVILDIKD